MAAAEAAAAGTPVVVTDRCGIAGFFEEGEALVVPYDEAAVVDALRTRPCGREPPRVAVGRRCSSRRGGRRGTHVTDAQEEIYREAIASRQASTSASTDGS